MLKQQQILPLIFAETERLQDFIGAQAQALLIPSLQDWARPASSMTVCLYGASGSGRTHLLRAAAGCAAQGGASVQYVSLRDRELRPEVLEGLEVNTHVCLDDLEAVLGRADWEWSLFALCNRMRTSGHALLIAGRDLPRESCTLHDLGSRLMAGLVFRIPALQEAELRQLIRRLAAHQGWALQEEVIEYLLVHLPRQAAAIQHQLREIDRYALQHQRPVTLHLVREVLRRRGEEPA